jgi:hypothetical protein
MADELTIAELTNYPTPSINSVIEIEELTTPEASSSGNVTIKQVMNMVNRLFRGSYQYNDAGTASSPIAGSADVALALTNDANGAGGFDEGPTGVGDLWDTSTQQFDWNLLSVGDIVTIRVDYDITTTTASQDVRTYLELYQGGAPYKINFGRGLVKTAGLYSDAGGFSSFRIKSTGVKTAPAQFMILSDAAFTVVVKGWYITVERKELA